MLVNKRCVSCHLISVCYRETIYIFGAQPSSNHQRASTCSYKEVREELLP